MTWDEKGESILHPYIYIIINAILNKCTIDALPNRVKNGHVIK